MKTFIYTTAIGLLWLLFVPELLQAERRSYDPIANITSTPSGTVFYDGVEITFSGETSDPVMGSINQYQWYWREGTSGTFNFIGYSSQPNREYTFPLLPSGVSQKTYQVKLRVRNTSNNWGSKIITVTVKRYPERVYFVKDHLGSVRTTVDEQGNIMGYDDYYPFGLQMPGSHSMNNANPKDDIKFTGYELDDEANLNLYHANARGYDPILGRFGQIDPAMEYASPYVYVGNNPMNLVDPTGMSSCDDGHYNCGFETLEEARAGYAAYWAGASYEDAFIERIPAEGEAGSGQTQPGHDAKKKHLDGKRNDLGMVGNSIRNTQLDSDIEKDLFENYWLGSGNIYLTDAEFSELSKAIINDGITTSSRDINISILGFEFSFKKSTVSLYSSSKYDRAFGSLTVITTQDGTPIAAWDYYNFDSKEWGERSVVSEIATRMVRNNSPKTAKPFYIIGRKF